MLAPSLPAVFEQVNDRVNWTLHRAPAADFAVNFDRGDCKTYSIDKMALLLQAGISPGRLTIWLVRDELGERHAVLVVDGATVLDNRFTRTESRSDLERYGYHFIYQQISGEDFNK